MNPELTMGEIACGVTTERDRELGNVIVTLVAARRSGNHEFEQTTLERLGRDFRVPLKSSSEVMLQSQAGKGYLVRLIAAVYGDVLGTVASSKRGPGALADIKSSSG